MGRMVRFEKKRPRAHRVDPLVQQTRSVEEPAGALNLGEGRCDCVRNGEAWRSAEATSYCLRPSLLHRHHCVHIPCGQGVHVGKDEIAGAVGAELGLLRLLLARQELILDGPNHLLEDLFDDNDTRRAAEQ